MLGNDNNVILNLVRDVAFTKHQILCVMHALQIPQCVCPDCIYSPTVTDENAEAVPSEQNNDTLNWTDPISNPQENVVTPPISRDSGISLDEEGSKSAEKKITVKLENVSFTEEDTEEAAVSIEIDGSKPPSRGEQQVLRYQKTKVFSLKNTNQIKKRSSSTLPKKSKTNGHTTTKRHCSSTPKSVVPTKKSDPDPAPREIQRREVAGRRGSFSGHSYDSAVAKLKTKKRDIRRFFSEQEKKDIYECYVKKGSKETAKEFGVSVDSIKWHVRSVRKNAKKNEKNKLNNLENVPSSNNNSNFNGDSTVKQETSNWKDHNVELKQVKEQNDLTHQESGQTENGEEKVQLKPVNVDPKQPRKVGRPGGSGKLITKFKKDIFAFYLAHGHVQTLRRFKISTTSLNYVLYDKENNKMRMDVKEEANGVSQTSLQNDDVGGNVFAVVEPRDEEKENGAPDMISLNNTPSTVKNIKSSLKCLTKEQLKQVFEVMRVLEESGKEITPDNFIEVANQRLPDFDPKTLEKVTKNWRFYCLKRMYIEEQEILNLF